MDVEIGRQSFLIFNQMGCESKAERKVKTHHVFVARLWIIAHLVVLTLASEVTKGVLVLYCWWDTKPIRLIGRWTFEVYHRRNRSEPIVVPFVRPNFLVLDLSMKPATSREFVSLFKESRLHLNISRIAEKFWRKLQRPITLPNSFHTNRQFSLFFFQFSWFLNPRKKTQNVCMCSVQNTLPQFHFSLLAINTQNHISPPSNCVSKIWKMQKYSNSCCVHNLERSLSWKLSKTS